MAGDYPGIDNNLQSSLGPRVCPTCGKCPTCGQGGYYIPMPAWTTGSPMPTPGHQVTC